MQQKNQSASEFSERTDKLSSQIGLSLRDLSGFVGVSQAMMFAYRAGSVPVSEKAWDKLKVAESKATYGPKELASEQAKEIGVRLQGGPNLVAKEATDEELVEAVDEWWGQFKKTDRLWMKKATMENLLIFIKELASRTNLRR